MTSFSPAEGAAKVRSVDLGNSFLADLNGVCEMLLVRHGEQSLVRNMPLAEGYDAPLSELGRRQAVAVGERLAEIRLHAVYSSTAARARDTGQAIAGHHEADLIEIESLVEINLWRDLPQDMGLIDALGEAALTEILRTANRTRRWDAYSHGEPREEFRARVVEAVESIAARHEGERVAVVCHSGVINAYLAHLFESDLDNLCTIHHTSITTVRASENRRRVVQVNDYAHVLPFQSELNPLNVA